MKRDFLKSLNIENELIDKIMEQYGSDIEKFKSINAEQEAKIKALEDDIRIRSAQLNELKDNHENIDDLKKKIESLQKENEENAIKYQSEIKNMKINNIVEKELSKAGAKNIQVTKPLLAKFLETAEIDEQGEIKDLADQIKNLTNSDETSFLFHQKIDEKPKLIGVSINAKADIPPNTKPDFSKMSYSQICDYMTRSTN